MCSQFETGLGLSFHQRNIDFLRFKVNLFIHKIADMMLAPPVCANNHAHVIACPCCTSLQSDQLITGNYCDVSSPAVGNK